MNLELIWINRASSGMSIFFKVPLKNLSISIIAGWMLHVTVSVLSAVFLSKYDFTGISSVLGIPVALQNKTLPNPRSLSWRNGMMGHCLLTYCILPPLSNSLIHVCENKSWREVEKWVLAALVGLAFTASGFGNIVWIDGIMNAEKRGSVLRLDYCGY